MSKNIEISKEFLLAGTKDGKIQIGEITEPYGKGSEAVVSIAISLSDEEPDWKVHIPYGNLDEVISALESIKK
ncbi:hypothetical protein ThvES_00007310 [Thiovulum sp. ES]|nr:hypothetical protein ThvES_00007310 [Thiovulum sp. ES]